MANRGWPLNTGPFIVQCTGSSVAIFRCGIKGQGQFVSADKYDY